MISEACRSFFIFITALVFSLFTLWLGLFVGTHLLEYELASAISFTVLLIFTPTYFALATISKMIDFLLQPSHILRHPSALSQVSTSLMAAAIVSYVFLILKRECVACAGNGFDFALFTLAIGVPHAIIHIKLRELLIHSDIRP